MDCDGFFSSISVTYDDEVLLLLLSYHRRLRMITEALELYVEGGRVSHSWCMCVAGYGGLGGGRHRGGGSYEYGTKPRGLVA